MSIDITCYISPQQGGMKAVLWTDFLQLCIMLAGMLCLTVLGIIKAGGLQHVYQFAYDNDRLRFDV